MTHTTTLAKLRKHNACARGYNLIANHIGVTGDVKHKSNSEWITGDNPVEIPLTTILDVNGLMDCLWSLRTVEGGKEIAIESAIHFAKRVYKEPKWNEWADKWLSGEDRSKDAAADAAYAADADDAYAAYAADAAADAADAAYAAAYAADAAYAARAEERKWQIEKLRELLTRKESK